MISETIIANTIAVVVDENTSNLKTAAKGVSAFVIGVVFITAL